MSFTLWLPVEGMTDAELSWRRGGASLLNPFPSALESWFNTDAWRLWNEWLR
jgi:hypothetical protein